MASLAAQFLVSRTERLKVLITSLTLLVLQIL